MVSLGDVCANNNNNSCPACGSSKMVRLSHLAVLQCNYCMIRFSEELMFMDRSPDEIASVIYELKRTWEKRLEVTNSMSTEALYDVLVQRGVLQPKPESPKITVGIDGGPKLTLTQALADDTAAMVDEQIKKSLNENLEADLIFLSSNFKLNIEQPKPWSYEEAAASEFNIDEGTGLQ